MLARHLVYKEKIGVNHSSEVAIKIPARDGGKELADGRMWKAMAGDMLGKTWRQDFCARRDLLASWRPAFRRGVRWRKCKMPMAGSRFAVEDGSVIDGPTSFAQPCFETRVRAGQIEVRASR